MARKLSTPDATKDFVRGTVVLTNGSARDAEMSRSGRVQYLTAGKSPRWQPATAYVAVTFKLDPRQAEWLAEAAASEAPADAREAAESLPAGAASQDDEVQAVIAQLTPKGRATMLAVGQRKLSFFDEGIVEHSGIWGECLTGEMGHKSAGVVNRLRGLGLWYTQEGGETDSGLWWALTALGAEVANTLAAESGATGVRRIEPQVTPAGVPATTKRGGAHHFPNVTTLGSPVWTRPADAAKNFRDLAANATGKAQAFWLKQAKAAESHIASAA